jgi:DNA-binding CsgD family transcriptional regulator
MTNMGKNTLRDQVSNFDFEQPLNPIQTVNGMKFTPREIDMLASILSGMSAKVMASFLDISVKTLEGHVHNLMLKCGCNARESIRALLENSDQVIPLRNHYIRLRLQEIFEKSFKKEQFLLKAKKPKCFLVYSQTKMNTENGLRVLKGYVGFEKFFNQLGIGVSLKPMKDDKSLMHTAKEHFLKQTKQEKAKQEKIKQEGYYFYFMEESVWSSLEKELGDVMEKEVKHIFFLLLREPGALKPYGGSLPKKLFGHFFVWLDILENMFPEINFKEITQAFRSQYDDLLEKNYQSTNTNINTNGIQDHINLSSKAPSAEEQRDRTLTPVQIRQDMPQRIEPQKIEQRINPKRIKP